MLKSGPMDIGAVGNWGTCGGGQLGCLEMCYRCLELCLLREECHMLPKIPALANEIADLWFFTKGLSIVVFPFTRFHKSPNSLSDQGLYKALMQVGLRFDDGRTHFGNTNTEQINGWPSHGRNQAHCGTM